MRFLCSILSLNLSSAIFGQTYSYFEIEYKPHQFDKSVIFCYNRRLFLITLNSDKKANTMSIKAKLNKFLKPVIAVAVLMSVTAVGAEFSHVIKSLYQSTDWGYTGFDVVRYAPPSNITDSYRQLPSTKSLRDQGVLFFAQKSDNTLLVYRETTAQVYHTDYLVPTMDVTTQAGIESHPVGLIVDNGIVVSYNGSWKSFNPISWTTNSTPKPSDLVLEAALASALPNVGVDFIGTDTFKNGAVVGQIEEGVYLKYKNLFTKLGFTSGTYSDSYGYPNFQTDTFVPMAFGANSVAWIGVDRALYIATVDFSKLKPTGIIDAPVRRPFKSTSSPTIYYNDGFPEVDTIKFMTSTAYKTALQDKTFSKVITLPDNATDFTRLRYSAEEVW